MPTITQVAAMGSPPEMTSHWKPMIAAPVTAITAACHHQRWVRDRLPGSSFVWAGSIGVRGSGGLSAMRPACHPGRGARSHGPDRTPATVASSSPAGTERSDMSTGDRVSTGSSGFDQVIDGLRLGDNVVWQVDSVLDYKQMVDAYVAQAKADGRRLVYVRFGSHEPLLEDGPGTTVCQVDPTQGFETFATEVHNLAERHGKGAFYVFDCLTDLLPYWHSDLMIGNFFKVTCPFLYELDTIAYFAIVRGTHTYATIATVRETTQLLLDLYRVAGNTYIHPLKVWQRYSPTMRVALPHLERMDVGVAGHPIEVEEQLGRLTDGRDGRVGVSAAHDGEVGDGVQLVQERTRHLEDCLLYTSDAAD